MCTGLGNEDIHAVGGAIVLPTTMGFHMSQWLLLVFDLKGPSGAIASNLVFFLQFRAGRQDCFICGNDDGVELEDGNKYGN